jgi:predicted ATP-grasp superfamily ATP-dependent carboligase
LAGELRSDLFPPLATAFGGKLEAPARIFVDEERNFAIFLGNFTPDSQSAHRIARAMIRWAKDKECALIVTSVGVPLAGEEETEHEITGVANGAPAEGRLREAGIHSPDQAVVSGIAASLLLEGLDAGIPVVALLIRTHEGMQDFEAGLRLAEALSKIVPEAQCQTEGLCEEAQRTEEALRRLKERTNLPGVYR